jgi:hypothetical protein
MGYSVNYFKKLRIPHIGEGRAKRYRRVTLEKWLAEGEPKPGEPYQSEPTPIERQLRRTALPMSRALQLLDRGGIRSKEVVQLRRGNWVKHIPPDFADNAMQGQVYFIDCQDCTKIGFTKQPVHKRIETWLIGNPFELTIFALMPGNRYDEFDLHLHFSDFRVRREWFRLPPEQRNEVIARVADRGGVLVDKSLELRG